MACAKGAFTVLCLGTWVIDKLILFIQLLIDCLDLHYESTLQKPTYIITVCDKERKIFLFSCTWLGVAFALHVWVLLRQMQVQAEASKAWDLSAILENKLRCTCVPYLLCSCFTHVNIACSCTYICVLSVAHVNKA